MKKLELTVTFIALVCIALLSGCSGGGGASMTNELTFDTTSLKEITIAYDDENITVFNGNDSNIIIKEYMNKDKKSYHAKVKEDGTSIHISEGGKPAFKDGFIRYIEIYLPMNYEETLNIGTTNGEIDCSAADINVGGFNINTTSGTVKLNNINSKMVSLNTTSGSLYAADIVSNNINIRNTSGNAVFDKLNGFVDYRGTSADLTVTDAVGSGQYIFDNSGDMQINYSEVTGDLSLYNKNDNVNLKIPQDFEFDMQTKSKNGKTSAPQGTSAAKIKIKAETVNGDINITQ